MNKKEWFEYHDNFCKKLREITAAKNADYTGGSSNPFENFCSVERDSIASTEAGFLVRMRDKFSRIISFVNQGTLQVKDESVQDTLLDLANYCILMSAYIESKKKSVEGPVNTYKAQGPILRDTYKFTPRACQADSEFLFKLKKFFTPIQEE